MTDRTVRLLRGLTVAMAAVALPVAGHLVAGGAAHLSAPTLLLFLLVAAVTTTVSAKEWTLPRIVAVLLPVQALVHVALSAGDGAHAAHGDPAALAHGTSDSSAATVAGPGMLAGHTIALAAVVLWLRMAERALIRLLALVARIFHRVTVTAAPTLDVVPPSASIRPLLPLRLTYGVRSRAPPVLSFV